MPRTLFILGTDPGYCAELQDALQAKISDNIVIVTPSSADRIASAKESNTIIIAGEERDISELYRHLLQQERQVNRASILAELIRLSITPLSVQEMLERVVAKSTEILGETALIVLEADGKYQLEAAFSKDAEQLKRMLITAVSTSPQAAAGELLRNTLEKGETLVIPNLRHIMLAPELQSFVEKPDCFRSWRRPSEARIEFSERSSRSRLHLIVWSRRMRLRRQNWRTLQR